MRMGLAAPSCSRLLRRLALVAALAAAACGGDDGGSGDDGGDDGSDGSGGEADAGGLPDAAPPFDATSTFLVLTSTAFEDGAAIPLRHACADHGGDDLSPALTWSGGPEAAGYAVVLTDRSIRGGFVHSVIWDIPGDVASLPEGVDKVAEPAEPAGAKQTLAYDNETRGYRGPCPPEEHSYEFALFALAENPLPGVTLDSTRDEVADALSEQAILSTLLVGTFTPPAKR